MQKIRWGILSTAHIGTGKVIPAMQRGEFCEVTAIASRNAARAATVAAHLGIPKAYGSNEELLADPTIDAIYNPLPNHLHAQWIVRCAEAKRHFLCEKPLATNYAEAMTAVEAARYHDVFLMEAFMYRCACR